MDSSAVAAYITITAQQQRQTSNIKPETILL
jgi:hypothetical protein